MFQNPGNVPVSRKCSSIQEMFQYPLYVLVSRNFPVSRICSSIQDRFQSPEQVSISRIGSITQDRFYYTGKDMYQCTGRFQFSGQVSVFRIGFSIQNRFNYTRKGLSKQYRFHYTLYRIGFSILNRFQYQDRFQFTGQVQVSVGRIGSSIHDRFQYTEQVLVSMIGFSVVFVDWLMSEKPANCNILVGKV